MGHRAAALDLATMINAGMCGRALAGENRGRGGGVRGVRGGDGATSFVEGAPDRGECLVVEPRGRLLFPATPCLELNPLGDLGGNHILKCPAHHSGATRGTRKPRG